MDLPVSFFVLLHLCCQQIAVYRASFSSRVILARVGTDTDLVVPRDGVMEIVCTFDTLITDVLFKKFLICTAVLQADMYAAAFVHCINFKTF